MSKLTKRGLLKSLGLGSIAAAASVAQPAGVLQYVGRGGAPTAPIPKASGHELPLLR